MNNVAKLITAMVIAFFILCAMFITTIVDVVHVEGNEAVVQQHWKKGVLPQVLMSGTHFIFPGYEYQQYKYNIGTQKVTFDETNSNSDAEYPRIPVEVGENGGQSAWVAVSVNYHINPEKLTVLHNQGIAKTYESVVLKREIVDAVNEIARPYKTALIIYSGEGFVEFKNRVENDLQNNKRLKERGIEVESTIVYKVYLEPRYEKEIADKQLAGQQYLTKVEQTKSSEQEAKRIFAESQANVEKARQEAESQKIKTVKSAEADAEQQILQAKAEKEKRILEAEGQRDASIAKASGILAEGEAQAKVDALKRESLYAGESGAWRAKVEIANAYATKLSGLLKGVSIVPEKTILTIGQEAIVPKAVYNTEE